jgi:hypothetical protein
MKILPLVGLLLWSALLCAQNPPAQTPPAPKPAEDYSGTYSFLQDGEFVQVNLEEGGKLTGYVSRYGDTETDRGLFLDHFFKEGKLDGKKLSFTTQVVHGVSFDFKGSFEHGEGKKAGEEGYYLLKGTLVQTTLDAQQKSTTKTREVVFKSFPQDMDPPEKKN